VSETTALPVHHIAPRRGIGDLGLGGLRHRGHLLWLLTARELRLRYVQTVLGPVWVVVNPLVPAVLFTFVFTKVATIDTDGVPYIILVTAALTPWNTVSRALPRAGGALVAQRSLLTKVYFPRLLIPLAIVLTCIVDHVVSLCIVAAAMVQSGTPATARLLVLPALMVWTLALALATSLLVAAVSVRRRDVLTALPIAIQIWLYVSPVAYPLQSLTGPARALVLLNPMTSLVEAHRWAVYGSSSLGATAMVGGMVEALVLLVVSLVGFRVAERGMADVI
jgi:lipopolysaccharide transport system permease protein